MPPFIIFKGTFPEESNNNGGSCGALYRKSVGLWILSCSLRGYKNFLFLMQNLPKEGTILLLLNTHASYCSEVIKLAKQSNVILLLALEPYTAHASQPLDVAAYKSFKVHITKHVQIGQML